MRVLRKPRFCIALLAGLAGGLSVWLLGPMPVWTARLPEPSGLRDGNPFLLTAISSNGRYLITQRFHFDADVQRGTIRVWDRERGVHDAIITVPQYLGSNASSALFSPDEMQIAIVSQPRVMGFLTAEKGSVALFDLASAQEIRQWTKRFHHVTFSPGGTLIVVTGGVLWNLETGAELRWLPDAIEDFRLGESRDFGTPIGAYRSGTAVYRRDNQIKLYSLHTEEILATHELPGDHMAIRMLSRNGKVMGASGFLPDQLPGSGTFHNVLIDSASKITFKSEGVGWNCRRVLSDNGHYLAEFKPTARPKWLEKWWPATGPGQSVHLTRWTTGQEVGVIGRVIDVSFSPDGSKLAVIREDAVIDVYEFPFRPPWGWIASAALLTATGSWCVGWTWSRRRRAPAVSP